MAVQYSIQKMVSNGTLSTIALGIQYLQRNDIYMRIAGVETPQSGAPSGYTWTFLDSTTLRVFPVIPNGVEVMVYRRTDIDAMYNVYSQNAQFDEATIDENNQQLLYIAQEYLEQGLPGAGVDTIEFLRDDGTYTYYRLKRTNGSYSDEFIVPSVSSAVRIIAREAMRRSYAEAGYNLVEGSFQAGFTLVNTNDVALDESTGKAFSGAAGTYPADTPTSGFTDKAAVTFRTGTIVTPEMYGDTSTPAGTAAAMNAAANACRISGAQLVAGKNAYSISDNVNLRSVRCDFSSTTITVDTGKLLIIGGAAGTTINPEQVFGIIKQPRNWSLVPDDYPDVTVRCMGAKGQTIRISQVDRLEFYQSTNPATFPNDASQAYSKFFIDFVVSLGVNTDPAYNGGASVDGPSSANQWFNENQLYLGRVISFYMRGSYRHNNNRIHGGCFETANAYLNIQIGNKNRFTDLRCEGAAAIVFGTETLGNVVDVNWFSSEAQIYQKPPAGGTIIDNGTLNIIKDSRIAPTVSDCVFKVTNKDTIHNGQGGNYNYRLATRRAIRSIPRGVARVIAESALIEASKGDYFFALAESYAGSSSYILRVYLYDSAGAVIAGNASNLETSVFNNVFSDRVEGRVTDAQAHHRFGVLSGQVRYVRLQLLTSGSASEDNARLIQVNRVSRAPGRDRKGVVPDSQNGLVNFAVSTPTQFLGNVGYLIGGVLNDYRCVFALDTTMAISASSGETVLTLTTYAATGLGPVAINDLIGIDTTDGGTHWTTVSAIGGGTLTIASALPSPSFVGDRVYVARLAVR